MLSSGILPGQLSIFAPGYSEPGVGEKESGTLEFEYCGSSLFMELTCWPRSFPVGKVCPNSSGYRTFPRYLPVSYSACHTVTWPDIVTTQGSQYRSRPWKALLVDFYFSLESRGDLWFYLYFIIDVQCFLQIKRPSAGQPCFLRMRKCNKARSSPALQQSGRCSTASVLSPVLPMGAVPVAPHLCSPTVLRNPTHAPKFFAWHRTFKASRTRKFLSVLSFLLCPVLSTVLSNPQFFSSHCLMSAQA